MWVPRNLICVLPFAQWHHELINSSLKRRRGPDWRVDPFSNSSDQSFFPGASPPVCKPVISTARPQVDAGPPASTGSFGGFLAIKPADSLLLSISLPWKCPHHFLGPVPSLHSPAPCPSCWFQLLASGLTGLEPFPQSSWRETSQPCALFRLKSTVHLLEYYFRAIFRFL